LPSFIHHPSIHSLYHNVRLRRIVKEKRRKEKEEKKKEEKKATGVKKI